MRQTQSIYNNNNNYSHYLRSRKLNDDHLYLIKHFGEKDKNNKSSYKYKEESKNSFINDDKITNKKGKYYPSSVKKRSKSYSKKTKDTSKIKKMSKSNKKLKKNHKGLEEQDLYINKTSNNSIRKINGDGKYQKIKQNDDSTDNNDTKTMKENNNKKSTDDYYNNEDDINDIKEINDDSNSNREKSKNKNNEVKAIIIDDKIVNLKDGSSKIQNSSNNNKDLNFNNNLKNMNNSMINNLGMIEKLNIKSFQENKANNKDFYKEKKDTNYLLNSLLKHEKEIRKLNNIEIRNKPVHISTYGKIINNKRVIFGIFQRPKDAPIPKAIRKRKRRRLKNILNYNKYLQKIANNVENENGFKYLFNYNHKIIKNYWHAKIDIISPFKKNIGDGSKRSESEDSFPRVRIGRKRGRKKRKKEMEDESYDEELSLFSALKNNLKKTDNDCEFLFNRSSMEKSSKSKSDLKQEHNMKSKEFSPHKNLDEKYNKYHNHNNNNNDFEENIEYLSITSTPEGKKRLRNNFSKVQYVVHNEVKRKNKKRKSNVVNNDNDNDNESNFNDSQFSVNILNEQKNNFDYNDIDIDIDLSNSFYDNKNDDKKSENNDNK